MLSGSRSMGCMNEKELYGKVLGISDPWRVESVDLRLSEGKFLIHVGHEDIRLSCPECGKTCALHDHAEERRWRHLDTCQYRTILCARFPPPVPSFILARGALDRAAGRDRETDFEGRCAARLEEKRQAGR